MVEVSINEKKISIEKGLTILQACEEIGIQIPRFCYHEQLSIAGNCRMCLVEIDRSIKPVPACALIIDTGIKIYTNTNIVKKAREGVMEFLLINHPLDCPICDQGGECDLQDQAMLFGNDRGRFYENKRSVSELDLGPFVKTVMTRCIHCTRCVRFLTELGGSFLLGTIGRGQKTEIGSYNYNKFNSEVMGNIIDLCPVGALTSKPYAFTTRSWELRKIESIDTLDSMGSNISYHINNGKVMRILPVLHMGINEEWLSDRTRFAYDGYVMQRIIFPMVKKDGILIKSKMSSLLKFFSITLNKHLCIVANDDFSLETIYTVKKLKGILKNTQIFFKNSFYNYNIDFRQTYIFNTTFAQVTQSDYCVLISINLKKEMPLLLLRLRKEVRNKQLKIAVFANLESYGLNEVSLGLNFSNFVYFCEGKHLICSSFKKAKFPMLICGNGILNSLFCVGISNLLMYVPNLVKDKWNGLNFVYNGIGDISAKEVGLQTVFSKQKEGLQLYNFNNNTILPNTVHNFFLGGHGDSIVSQYSKILPLKVAIEDSELFINVEGRAQMTKKVQLVDEGIKREWEYLSFFFDVIFSNNDTNKERVRKDVYTFLNLSLNIVGYGTFMKLFKKKSSILNLPLLPYVITNYGTNPICKNSLNLEKAIRYTKIDNYK